MPQTPSLPGLSSARPVFDANVIELDGSNDSFSSSFKQAFYQPCTTQFPPGARKKVPGPPERSERLVLVSDADDFQLPSFNRLADRIKQPVQTGQPTWVGARDVQRVGFI